jgi:hypothetical protein
MLNDMGLICYVYKKLNLSKCPSDKALVKLLN